LGRQVGRYTLYDEVAAGGMATVYLARMRGEGGFSRMVAVKMLHAHYAQEASFRAMFLDEARLVSRIRHPNVVATLDVVQDAGELFLVMEYVHGESLSRLLRTMRERGEQAPIGVVLSVMIEVLEGLHAAHEAKSEAGEPLQIVHRDVSPQNVLVGTDGVAHVADFGIAKAEGRLAEKFSNQAVKGKAGYMAPEQMRGQVDRRSDVFAVGVCLWEMLTGGRLFTGESFLEIVTKSLDAQISRPSSLRPEVPPLLDDVVMRAVSRSAGARFATARDMALALEASGERASARDVGAWVTHISSDSLETKTVQLKRIEQGLADDIADTVSSPSVQTVAGIAPSHGAVRTARMLWLVPLAAAVVVTAIMVPVHSSHNHPLAPPPSTSEPITTQTAAPLSSMTMTSVAPLESAPVVPLPASAHLTTRPAHAPTVVEHNATPSATSSAPCHWVELPDSNGILIPKKVCL